MKRYLWPAGSALGVLLIFAAGCGGGGDGNDNSSNSGTINISGSSTVEPISVRVAELFEDVDPSVGINVDGPGTGDGFRLFCDGETDISNASRPIKDSEARTCSENGIEWVELKIAIDGIAVITSEDNDAINCISHEELYALVGPESLGFRDWADANALISELGGDGDFPDEDLDIFGPGEESGTYDSFVELVLEDIAEERGEEAETRPDYSSSADDNIIVQRIQGSNFAIGWVGYSFAADSTGIKLLEVDDGQSGCVAPAARTISSGEYPISRPLFIYVNLNEAEQNPAIVEYVDFYLTNEVLGAAISEVGYVSLDPSIREENRQSWQDR